MIEAVNPPDWEKPKGYANGMLVDGARLYTGGQIGWNKDQVFEHQDFVGQLRTDARQYRGHCPGCGRRSGHRHRPADLVHHRTRRPIWRTRRKIGAAYRKVMGRHFPSMSVVVVAALIEDAALVEIEATAEIGKSRKDG